MSAARLLLFVLLLFVLAPSASAGSEEKAVLRIEAYKFLPSRLEVSPGQTVGVLNGDDEPHAIRTNDGKALLLSNVDARTNASFVAPAEPGEYAYYCPYHTSPDPASDHMQGVLVVAMATSATPTPTTPGEEIVPGQNVTGYGALGGFVLVALLAFAMGRRR